MRGLVWLGLIVFLSACQTRIDVREDAQQDWLQGDLTQTGARIPESWELSARVAVIVAGKSEQANLVWNRRPVLESPRNNNIRLFGPFGAGAVQLSYGERTVVLKDNKGREHWGDDAQTLLTDIVGWPLPVHALSYWLFAQAAPDVVFDYQVGDTQPLTAIRQLGWRIEFKDWRSYQDRNLPRRLFAYRELSGSGEHDLTVKLIVKDWEWP